MSNYTKIVNYAVKDALVTGDPNKKILGAQIDAEYVAISTAISSKEDTTNKGIANGYCPLDANGDANALGLVVTGSFVPVNGVYLPGANTVGISTNSTLKVSVNANGVVTIAQPAAGNPALIASAVNGGATEAIRILTGSLSDPPWMAFTRVSTQDGRVGTAATANDHLTGTVTGDLVLRGDTAGIVLGNSTRNIVMKLANAGNITMNAPSSGITLTVNGAGEAIRLVGDTSIFEHRNTALTGVLQIGTVNGVTGAGSVTDGAVLALANLQFFGTGASNPTMQITSTVVSGRGPVAGALVDMTPDSGSFTITYTGFTANPTATCFWARQGNIVTLLLPGGTGTSNATTFQATGMPASIQPTRAQLVAITNLVDNGINSGPNCATVNPGGSITFSKGPQQGVAWTASGTKAVNSSGVNISYFLT